MSCCTKESSRWFFGDSLRAASCKNTSVDALRSGATARRKGLIYLGMADTCILVMTVKTARYVAAQWSSGKILALGNCYNYKASRLIIVTVACKGSPVQSRVGPSLCF
jgi:hypothetical protein